MDDQSRCEYCGFWRIVSGPRECCRAGKDVDALREQIESLTRRNDTLHLNLQIARRESSDSASGES